MAKPNIEGTHIWSVEVRYQGSIIAGTRWLLISTCERDLAIVNKKVERYIKKNFTDARIESVRYRGEIDA